MAAAAQAFQHRDDDHHQQHDQQHLACEKLLCDGAEEAAWATLLEVLPEQAARLQRVEALEQSVSQRLLRKRRLGTLHMLGPSTSTHTLRLWVTHAVQHPPPGGWPKAKTPRALARLPMWTLRVEGGLLAEEDGHGSGRRRLSRLGRLSEFFERMTVTLDRVKEDEERAAAAAAAAAAEGGKGQQEASTVGAAGERKEGEKVEWVRPKETYGIEVDGFQVTLSFPSADVTELPLRIALHRRQLNPLLTPKKLSPELAKLLRLRREERREAIEAALFEAIRGRQWFLPQRPGWVTLDAEAAKLLGLPHGAAEEAGRTLRLPELNAKVEEHLSEAEPWSIDYDVSLHEGDGAEAAVHQDQREQELEEGADEEDEQRRWKGRRVFDVRVDAPAGGGLLPRFSLVLQEEAQAAARALQRTKRRARAREDGNVEEEEEEEEEEDDVEAEEADAARLGGWEARGSLARRVERRMGHVGGLLTEKARKIARLRAVAADPGKALSALQAEEEVAAALALGEAQGSVSTMAALLRGQQPFSSSSSLRWMTEAMQNYLARPTAFK